VSTFDDLPPLREVIARHGIAAERSLGQNFILDLNLTAKIARAAGHLDGKMVLEIGPGPGGLTRAILAAGAAHVVAIERDRRCLPALEEIAARYPGRLSIHHGDALALDHSALLGGNPAKIIANLPYNVGTELLLRWLTPDKWPPFWTSATLMFQREVADRIVATPVQRKDYGRLGVLAGWRTEASIAFDLPPSAFTPPPKVKSSVVSITPRPDAPPCAVKALERVTAAAFGQRRKMLRQALKSLGDAEALLSEAGIDPTLRAEAISVDGFLALAGAFDRRNQR
jgi:16S rRNA (adenine1518-N6/adenine1519-N6)-dimethyltransferase